MSDFAPVVSVVIPTYNRAGKLRTALGSVAAQTYRDFEVIVVDDGSSDDTREVVEAFRARVPSMRYVFQPNRGQAKALNAGLRVARGAYAAFLDDDDAWMPEKLARQVARIESDPAVGLVYTAIACTKGGAILRRQPERPGFTLREMVERGCFIHCSAVLIRRACLDLVGMFDETMSRVKDFDLWMRIARHYRLAYLDDVLATYAQHESNMTHDHLAGARGHLQAIQHVAPLPAAGVTWWLLRRRRAELHYRVARLTWDAAQYRAAAKHFAWAIWEWPVIGARVRGPGASWGQRAAGLLKPLAGGMACLIRVALNREPSRSQPQLSPPSLRRTSGKPPIRILILLHRCEQIGAAQSICSTIERLDPARFQVTVASPGLGVIEPRMQRAGAQIITMPILRTASSAWWTWPLLIWALSRLIRRTNADVVHVNFHTIAPPAVAAARLAGVPAIVHVRVILWLSWWERWALRQASRVICVSKAVERAVCRRRRSDVLFRLDAQRCLVWHDGRNLARFQDAQRNGVRQALGIDAASSLIGIIGTLEPNKRQDLFLRVAAEVAKEEPTARFLVVGEPNMEKHRWFKDELLRLRDDLGLTRQVMFTGWRQDIPDLMKALDLSLLLSKRDAFPGVLIESMAAGVPVVSSLAGGGPREVVGPCGLVLDSDDPRVYAKAVVDLLRDPAKRRAMSEQGQQRVRRYDVKQTAPQLAALYEALASR